MLYCSSNTAATDCWKQKVFTGCKFQISVFKNFKASSLSGFRRIFKLADICSGVKPITLYSSGLYKAPLPLACVNRWHCNWSLKNGLLFSIVVSSSKEVIGLPCCLNFINNESMKLFDQCFFCKASTIRDLFISFCLYFQSLHVV